jgi:hypothetical protein
MLEDPSVATRWRNLVNSTQDKWAHENKSAESDEESSDGSDGGVLFERDTKAVGFSNRIIRALAGFFTARAWKPRVKRRPYFLLVWTLARSYDRVARFQALRDQVQGGS